MSFTILKKNPTQGEITSSLTGSTGDGAGLHFNGSGYVSAGDTTVIDGATKLSVEVIAATTAADNGEMVAKAHDATALRFYINTSGQVVFRVNNGSGNGTATSSGTVNNGNPTHIVGVWDGSTVKIYINGNEDGSGDLVGGGFKNVTDQLALGAQQSSGGGTANKFTGTLYRARLFNYAVDAKALFENGASVDYADQYGNQTNLVSGYDFTSGYSAYGTGAVVDSNTYTTGGAGSGIQKSLLTVGKKYRVTVAGSSSAGDFQIQAYGTWTVLATGFGTHEFTATTAAIALTATANSTVDVTSFSITAIGAVVDLDLSAANETQSRVVQDRSGAADCVIGITGGVTQVQPVVQLNSTSARIGTTAATPADNSILVSDLVQAERLIAKKSTGSGNTEIKIENDSASNAAVLTLEGKRTSDNDCAQILIANSGENVAAIKGFRSGANDAGKLEIQTSASGSSGLTTRLTIDSTGQVSIAGNASADANADDLVIGDSSGNRGLTIQSGATSGGNIYFADGTGANHYQGSIIYNHSSDSMQFATMRTGQLTIDHTGHVAIGDDKYYQWGGTNARIVGSHSGDYVKILTGNSAKLTVDSTGLATFSNGITVNDSAGGMAQIQTGGAVTMADDASITLSTTSNQGSLISVYHNTFGSAVLFYVTYSAVAQIISDPDSFGSASDTDGKMCMIKAGDSHSMTFKNRLGSSVTFKIAQLGGNLV